MPLSFSMYALVAFRRAVRYSSRMEQKPLASVEIDRTTRMFSRSCS